MAVIKYFVKIYIDIAQGRMNSCLYSKDRNDGRFRLRAYTSVVNKTLCRMMVVA